SAFGATAQDPAQVGAVDELHREEESPLVEADIVHVDDVRVVERRTKARLVDDEPLVRCARTTGQNRFEHDELLELRDAPLARQVKLPHPTAREVANDFAAAERLG